jgi:hypothetical protein
MRERTCFKFLEDAKNKVRKFGMIRPDKEIDRHTVRKQNRERERERETERQRERMIESMI